MLKLTNFKWLFALTSLFLITETFAQKTNCGIYTYTLGYPYKTLYCSGDEILFTANIQNGNENNHYEWYVGDRKVGTDSDEYLYTAQKADNGKNVYFKLITDACGSYDTITSNQVQKIHVDDFLSKLSIQQEVLCDPNLDSLTVIADYISFNFKWYVNNQLVDNNPNDNSRLKFKPEFMEEGTSIHVTYQDNCPNSTLFSSEPVSYNKTLCDAKNGDLIATATPLTNNTIITSSISDYKRGRRELFQTCTTNLPDENVIDIFYEFTATSSSLSVDLTVDDPTWKTSMVILNTSLFQAYETCQQDVDPGKTNRKYTIDSPYSIYEGYKYILKLEIGADSPLGNARLKTLANNFSIKITDKVSGIAEVLNATKTLARIYNLQGIEVNKDYKGLVIYQFTDGSTQKTFQE